MCFVGSQQDWWADILEIKSRPNLKQRLQTMLISIAVILLTVKFNKHCVGSECRRQWWAKVSDSVSCVVCFWCLACPFTFEGVINPAAFPPLMTKCWLDSASWLWPRSKALQPAIHHQILIWFRHHAGADIWFITSGAILEFLTVNKGSLGNVNVLLVWGLGWCK